MKAALRHASSVISGLNLRLERRFRQVLMQLSDTEGPSIPFASQDWAQAKAAYRFFSNPRVDEYTILSGHMRCTQERSEAAPGPLIILHDTPGRSPMG